MCVRPPERSSVGGGARIGPSSARGPIRGGCCLRFGSTCTPRSASHQTILNSCHAFIPFPAPVGGLGRPNCRVLHSQGSIVKPPSPAKVIHVAFGEGNRTGVPVLTSSLRNCGSMVCFDSEISGLNSEVICAWTSEPAGQQEQHGPGIVAIIREI